MDDQNNNIFRDCIQACLDCALACENCAKSSLKYDEEDIDDCLSLCIECSKVCTHTAQLLGKSSTNSMSVIEQCIVICEKCAAACGNQKREQYKLCSQACTQCAVECRKHLIGA